MKNSKSFLILASPNSCT